MNRRNAIFAMLCAVAGRRAIAAQDKKPDTLTATGISLVQGPMTFMLDLMEITKFTFLYQDEELSLSGKEIWDELHRAPEGK